MTTRDLRKIERETTRWMNRKLKKVIGRLPYNRLRTIYADRLANWETRRLVRAEARRRGYKPSTFEN